MKVLFSTLLSFITYCLSQGFAFLFVLIFLFLFTVPFLFHNYNPIIFSNITYTASESSGDIEKLPVKFSSGNVPETWTLEFDMYIPPLVWIMPQYYKMTPDDCILELKVNNVDFVSPSIPFCSLPNGHQINLRHLLKPGTNHMVAHIDNRYGGATGFRMSSSFSEEILQSTGFIPFVLLIMFYGFFRLREND